MILIYSGPHFIFCEEWILSLGNDLNMHNLILGERKHPDRQPNKHDLVSWSTFEIVNK